ncbi:MAG: PEP-utilizing enzyme [Candidatus Micrarchaeota archaeon]|nr:PEP-utilizing enzyme [Candidatus Micrarchaeota archaeon]
MAEQIYSMTNWMQEIKKHFNTDMNLQPAIDEDLEKFPRLAKLNAEVGTPIDRPQNIPVDEFLKGGENFERFFAENCKSGRYSIKAQPLEKFKNTLFRNRLHGVTQQEAIEFVKNLKPDPFHYSIQIWEYFDSIAGGIFTVSERGIYGEFTKGKHFNLTQGIEAPITSFVNFRTNEFSISDYSLASVALAAFNLVKAKHTVNMGNYPTFNDYLAGYFEFIYYGDGGYRFIDYNTTSVMNNIRNIEIKKGNCASPGKATGIARHIKSEVDFAKFCEGDVLIAEFTNPAFVPIMAKASAIITTKGGLLSHAAIISRELKKPCLVGMKKAFEYFPDGSVVEVDGDNGIAKVV